MNTKENVTKSNVFYILDARMEKSDRKFHDGVDSAYKATLAQYEAYSSIPKVQNVLNSMFDVLHLELKMEKKQIAKLISTKELPAIQMQLDARSGAALEAFFAKVKNASDFEDPLVLTVFEAASDFLVRYLQLLDQNFYDDEEAFATHHELECDRQPPKTRRPSRKQKSPQGADGTR